MAVVRWDPWGDLAALQRDVNELFGRPVAGSGRAVGGGSVVPPIDAYATESGTVVQVDLPGFRPEDVDVQVHEGVLIIAGERRSNDEVADDAWVRRERVRGRFERSLSLPEGTVADEITASFAHGVLELAIPHAPERKPRRIPVSVSSGEAGGTVDVNPQA